MLIVVHRAAGLAGLGFRVTIDMLFKSNLIVVFEPELQAEVR